GPGLLIVTSTTIQSNTAAALTGGAGGAGTGSGQAAESGGAGGAGGSGGSAQGGGIAFLAGASLFLRNPPPTANRPVRPGGGAGGLARGGAAELGRATAPTAVGSVTFIASAISGSLIVGGAGGAGGVGGSAAAGGAGGAGGTGGAVLGGGLAVSNYILSLAS